MHHCLSLYEVFNVSLQCNIPGQNLAIKLFVCYYSLLRAPLQVSSLVILRCCFAEEG